MRAIAFERHGGPEVLGLEDIPRPSVGPGEALLRVRAVSVNRTTDVALRERAPAHPIPMPHVPGIDPSGVVEEVGPEVGEVERGDRVVAIPNLWCGCCEWCRRGLEHACERARLLGVHTQGGYAEYVAVPARNLVRLPDELSHEQAAALIAVFPVAWHLLIDRARLRPGETVLVLAAGGSLGVAGLQIAGLAGARVIAAAGAQWKLERARALGAKATVNYRAVRLSEAVRELTGGRGVDVVFENVSSPELWPESLASLAIRGRLVTCGAHGGGQVRLDMRDFYRRHLAILSAAGGPRAAVDTVVGLVAQKRLTVQIHRTFPLAEAAAAHELVAAGEVFGRVLLMVP